MKPFYITTTLPYVNADPHMGHATEFIRADVVARYKSLMGYDVFFNTGTDEHGQKVFEAAQKEGLEIQEYVDKYAERFKKAINILGLSENTVFIRTTNPSHIKATQEFWKICKQNGYIYKKMYKRKYCVGCEAEKNESELDESGRCPLHPNSELEIIEEENYFFKYSAFQQKLLDLYKDNPDFVIPSTRQNEIRSFVERGLEDFSISRLKSKMSWGIEVPDDSEHVMYVWFDALVNYISTLGWPDDKEKFEKYWVNGDVVQYCGKDNLRFQSAMWQAMLMSVGISNSKHIVINGFITAEGGVKMSKSLGNVVSPEEIISEYGVDALRYYVLREFSPFEDSPFSKERFKEVYNANLANGLGNLASRVLTMSSSYGIKTEDELTESEILNHSTIKEFYRDNIESFNLQKACDFIWQKIGSIDRQIEETKPFKLIKENPKEASEIIIRLLKDLRWVAVMLRPMMPSTSKAILEAIKENKKPNNLFPKIE